MQAILSTQADPLAPTLPAPALLAPTLLAPAASLLLALLVLCSCVTPVGSTEMHGNATPWCERLCETMAETCSWGENQVRVCVDVWEDQPYVWAACNDELDYWLYDRRTWRDCPRYLEPAM